MSDENNVVDPAKYPVANPSDGLADLFDRRAAFAAAHGLEIWDLDLLEPEAIANLESRPTKGA